MTIPEVASLPKLPGVYLYKDREDKVIYVGKAKSLRDRVSQYFSGYDKKTGFKPAKDVLPRTAWLISEISHIDHIVVESEIDALLFEANLIRKFQPKYNVNWKDGKSYPLMEITIKEKVPLVRYARQELNPKAKYFGPYPTGSDLTGLLRFLRQLFPFVSQPHPGGKPCLRSHLNLCPCPDVFVSGRSRQKYKRELKKLMEFLEGKRQQVQKELTKEMTEASKKLEFEKANALKLKLEKIAYLTAPRTQGFEYEVNPNLISDKYELELAKLADILKTGPIKKIECYDISNTSGRNATAAQVTFVNGTPDKSLYRRYKIKLTPKPGEQNDFAMLSETLARRLKSDIPLPELIVIDGGKGQLSTILKTIKAETKAIGLKNTKIISLAKQFEIIYTDTGEEITLKRDDPSLKLIQRLRDEAHRFSRKYHFLLRKKSMFD
jgi:excinuclease ABC subunit C